MTPDRLVEKHDPEGNIWTYTYDAQGNLLSESQPSDTDPNGIITFHEYDTMNRRVLTYDELGNQTRFKYDQLGRLVRKIDADGSETDFSYDGLGRLACVVDAEDGLDRIHVRSGRQPDRDRGCPGRRSSASVNTTTTTG